jgi:hypothetical protein
MPLGADIAKLRALGLGKRFQRSVRIRLESMLFGDLDYFED